MVAVLIRTLMLDRTAQDYVLQSQATWVLVQARLASRRVTLGE